MVSSPSLELDFTVVLIWVFNSLSWALGFFTMNPSKQTKIGIENRAAKPNRPMASKVVTRAETRPRRVLSDIGNLGCHASKPNGGDEIKLEKSRKQNQLADKQMPRRFGVDVKNTSATTRSSSMPLGPHRNKDEKGSIRSTLVSKSKHVAGSGKAPGISNVGPSHTRESVSGKLPRVSNVEVSSNDPSSSRIQRRPSTSLSGKNISASGRSSTTGLSGKHTSASGRPSTTVLSSKCTSASGRPPRPSNVDISGKAASNASKSRFCPPEAKGVSRRMPMTDASKRKTRLPRAFTSTLTARSEIASGAIERDAMEEEGNLPNIDEADNENQLAVVEYVQDIYHFYWYTEACNNLSSNYMSSQVDINQKMREILIDWLTDVHLKFDLMHETLFLMINLIDRFLSVVYTITRKDIQLVGLTAMLVAAKYEEIWAPKVKDLITISNNVYTRGEFLSMEKLMLNKLRFNLAVPTPFVFMKRFLKAAQADTQLELLAFYLLELCLVEYEALKWKPSMLAASAIYMAQHILQRMPAWTRLLQKHAHYRESELRECANMIAGFHRNAEEGDLKAVYNKYSSSQFGAVAKLPFAVSPLLGN